MDDHTFEGHIGGARIDLDDYFDLRSWAKRFDVTAGDVRRAVSAVGNRATDVEAWLARRRQAIAANRGHEVGSPG